MGKISLGTTEIPNKISLGSTLIQKVSMGLADIWTGSIPFVTQGMDLATDFNLGVGSTYVKVPGWGARSGVAGTIVNDGLVMPTSETVDIVMYVLWNSSSASSRKARVMKNGTTQLGEVVSSGTHGSLTLSLTSIPIANGDSLTVEGYSAGTASTRQINATSYLVVAKSP